LLFTLQFKALGSAKLFIQCHPTATNELKFEPCFVRLEGLRPTHCIIPILYYEKHWADIKLTEVYYSCFPDTCGITVWNTTKKTKGWWHGLVVEYFPIKYEVLSLTPPYNNKKQNTQKNKQKNGEEVA
jgi:hypothetical protein